MKKIKIWIKTLNFRTIPLSISGILMGSAIAFNLNFVDWTIFTFAMLTTVLFQLLSNVANDYGDGVKGTDSIDRVGPIRGVQSGEISINAIKRAVIIISVLALISAAILIYLASRNMPTNILWFYAFLAVASVVAAITYTVGKRAYGYYGMGDPMVFIFFGCVSVLGVFSLYTQTFDWINLLPATTIGLLCVGVLNVNNMRDYYSDTQTSKTTLVVKMGLPAGKIYHIILISVAILSLIVFLLLHDNILYFISLIPCIVLSFHLIKIASSQESKDFDPQLKVVVFSTFGISLLYFICSLL